MLASRQTFARSVFLALLFLAFLSSFHSVEAAKPLVAVMPFEDGLIDAGRDSYWLRREARYLLPAIQEALTDRLIEMGEFQVLERSRLDEILAELRFQSSDWVDPLSAARLGRILGTQYLILGTLSKLDTYATGYIDGGDVILRAIGADVELRARVVAVETSVAVASVSSSSSVRSGQLAVFMPHPISASFRGDSVLERAIREAIDDLAEKLAAVFKEDAEEEEYDG